MDKEKGYATLHELKDPDYGLDYVVDVWVNGRLHGDECRRFRTRSEAAAYKKKIDDKYR